MFVSRSLEVFRDFESEATFPTRSPEQQLRVFKILPQRSRFDLLNDLIKL